MMLDVDDIPNMRPCSINMAGRWAILAPSLAPAPDPAPAPAPTPAPIATLIPTPTLTPVTRLTTGLSVSGADVALEVPGIDASEFPRLIVFNDGGVFRYRDLVSGEEFTVSLSRFGRVHGGAEHRVTGKGVVSRPRSMASADRSRFSSARPFGGSTALKDHSGFGRGF